MPEVLDNSEARCRGHDEPDLWFSPLVKDQRRATAICNRCPIQEKCLAHAVENDEVYGIWGGVTEDDVRELIIEKYRQRRQPFSLD